MTRELYFTAPVDLSKNGEVHSDFTDRASATSPVSKDRLRFQKWGPGTLVVTYDDDGEATQTSIDGLRKAVEAVYGVTHERTEKR